MTISHQGLLLNDDQQVTRAISEVCVGAYEPHDGLRPLTVNPRDTRYYIT
jgi:hypothetical protein